MTNVGAAVGAGCNGLVIIENCEVKLHDAIEKIFDATESELKVVTVSFYHDKVNNSVHIQLEKLGSEMVLELIREILPDAEKSVVDRIEKFVEGFPLLAEMITTQLLKEGSISANFTERDLVEKLINGDGNLSAESRELLKVFSLFDYFPYQNVAPIEPTQPVDFINKIAGTNQRDFDFAITQFTSREIIICTGPLARLVPKPLALNLAMEWWNSSLFNRQSELISELPPSMLESFCGQIKYLDNSINAQSFVESFLDAERPFGQAELLLSKKGSRLFRSLVEVNPKATSESLYRIFEFSDDDVIRNISGDVRRNLIWALEMLCFHKSYFMKSSWCLFRLACFENESYSNNATGQWSQVFRWQLSGTEANFEQRLAVLHRALQLNSERADMVVIDAIKTAISTFGGSRTIGAEFQGTKPEMKEWRPEVWQEIFDYWQQLFDILVTLAKKPYALEAVKETIGHQIRGLIGPGTIDMLDKAITEIILINGKYWPSASQSIVHALEYDAGGMKKDSLDALLSWQERLSPDVDNFKERLTLIVLDPSREHEEGDDGKLIDRAAEEAIAFAKELTSIDELNQNVEFILGFKEQKQSWVFGRELALGLNHKESQSLFSVLIEVLLQVNESRFEFVDGYLSGIYTKDEDAWSENVKIFCAEEKLFKYYPQAVRSGKCTIDQLHIFIKLVREGALESSSTAMFSYGRAVDHLSEEDVVYFCHELSQISPQATWGALDILSMYMFGRDDYDFEKLKPTLEQLLLGVSFIKEDKLRHTDGYHWLKSVEKLLANNGLGFAQHLVKELVDQVTKNDIDFSDLWDVFHPAFYKAFEYYANEIWPSFSKEILLVTEHRRQYRLQELFGSGKESRRKTNSIFTLIDEGKVVDWCENETALMYVVRSLKLFDSTDEEKEPNSLLIRLVDVYGQNQDFLSEIRVNFHTRSWSGSIIPGLQSDKTALQPLLEHESHPVRQWVSDFISMIDSDIDQHNKQESEERFARGM